MSKLDGVDVEHVKDLLKCEGWKILKAQMQERRSITLNSLASAANMETVFKLQAKIAEIDYLLKAPHEWIKNNHKEEI